MSDFLSQFDTPEDPQIKQAREALLANILRRTNQPPQAPPTSPEPYMSREQAMQHAQGMRDQQRFGNILQASGDRVLSPLGKSLAQQNDPDRFLQQKERQDQVRAYQDWQMSQAAGNQEANFLTESLKQINAMQQGPGQSKMPSGWGEKLLTDSSQIRSLGRSHSTLRPEYTQSFGQALKLAGYSGPIEGIGRWMTQNTEKLTTPEMKAAAQWWADLEANVIAPWRNDLFGATLTANEQRAFNQLANMHPGMSEEEIARRLSNLQTARIEGARDRVTVTLGNYGKGHLPMLQQLYKDVLNDPGTVDYSGGAPGSSPGSPSGIRVQWKGEEEEEPLLPGRFVD